jgi:hypothetical protein
MQVRQKRENLQFLDEIVRNQLLLKIRVVMTATAPRVDVKDQDQICVIMIIDHEAIANHRHLSEKDRPPLKEIDHRHPEKIDRQHLKETNRQFKKRKGRRHLKGIDRRHPSATNRQFIKRIGRRHLNATDHQFQREIVRQRLKGTVEHRQGIIVRQVETEEINRHIIVNEMLTGDEEVMTAASTRTNGKTIHHRQDDVQWNVNVRWIEDKMKNIHANDRLVEVNLQIY